MNDAMAAQLAQLLAESDLDELKEIVARWKGTAPDARTRAQYEELGSRLVELKGELAKQPTAPTREELQVVIAMMMRLAQER